MPGIGMVLNTAKLAIAAQQQGLSVTSHNIANVNSPYYSRQSPVLTTSGSVQFGGYWIGTGVEMTAVQRSADQMLEDRLIDIKSDLAQSEELASYMSVFETALNENTDSGLNNLMSEFWNSWQGVSNNPTGTPERVVAYEKGMEMAERFDTLANDLLQIEVDLNTEISSMLTEIGSICSQIGDLNNQLIGQDVPTISHDMLDQRNGLMVQLAELIGVNSFEQPDGSLSVVTAGGYNLVNGADALSLTFDAGRVEWEGSCGAQVDITDRITGGKLSGWLEMRDEVVAKYQAELDALAHEFIWTVNYQHSQGVGLEYFDSAVTGTYETDSSGMMATLDYGDKIDYTGDFKLWAADSTGAATATDVSVDMSISTASTTFGGTASDASSTYTITMIDSGSVVAGAASANIDFEWASSSTSDTGTATLNMGANSVVIDGMTLTFGNGTLMAGNTLEVNTLATAAPSPATVTLAGTANSILDNYQFTVSSVTGGGVVGTDTIAVDWSNSVTSGSFTLDAATTDATVDGMTITFVSGAFAADDVFTIETDSSGSPTEHMMPEWHWTLTSFEDEFNRQAVTAGVNIRASATTEANKMTFDFVAGAYDGFAFSDDTVSDSGLAAALGINTFFSGNDSQSMAVNSVLDDRDLLAAASIDATTGEFGVGDNRNANSIADLKYSTRSIAEWTYERDSDAVSQVKRLNLEDYYQKMVGSIGVESANAHRSVTFNESLAEKLGEQRDNLSAVSLDEEMISMMRFQHAYTVASKLLSVADEMLMTLVNSKR